MKNYFKFNLTGKKLLPLWLLFMFLFLVPYVSVQFKLQSFQHNPTPEVGQMFQRISSMFMLYGVMLILVIIEYVFFFYLIKMAINNTEFKGKVLEFKGQIGEFISVFLFGLLLTIITFGIYSPWFITDVYKFFTKNTHYNESAFEFKGKAGNLFLIITLTLILPMIVFMVIMFTMMFKQIAQSQTPNMTDTTMSIIMMGIIFIMMIPYMYFVYKWMVNLVYKNYQIQWETSFWPSVGVITGQILLTVITAGIYLPLASLKLYQYFAEKTFAKSELSTKTFGYEIEPLNDFLFIWGQSLLSIITLGIYYPWAFCKITDRITAKTFMIEIN